MPHQIAADETGTVAVMTVGVAPVASTILIDEHRGDLYELEALGLSATGGVYSDVQCSGMGLSDAKPRLAVTRWGKSQFVGDIKVLVAPFGLHPQRTSGQPTGINLQTGELGVMIVGYSIRPVGRPQDEGAAEGDRRRRISILFQTDEATGINHGHLRAAWVTLRLMIDAHQCSLALRDAVKDDIHWGSDAGIRGAYFHCPAIAWTIDR